MHMPEVQISPQASWIRICRTVVLILDVQSESPFVLIPEILSCCLTLVTVDGEGSRKEGMYSEFTKRGIPMFAIVSLGIF